MVNLVLQQKNSGCAVSNGPGIKCLTAPLGLYVVFLSEYDTFEEHPMVQTLTRNTTTVSNVV